MKFARYQIDAFADKIFGGNPACTVPLEDWLSGDILLKIAKEYAVVETAFFVDKGEIIHLRWFTPEIEMDLYGHETLATAHCLKSILNHSNDNIILETLSGDLTVFVKNDFYCLNFPSGIPDVPDLPEIIGKSLNIQPKEVLKLRDYLLVYDAEQEIRNIKFNRQIFDPITLDPEDVIVPVKGAHCDIVSGFYTPEASILEDLVTSSVHCPLNPLWANRL